MADSETTVADGSGFSVGTLVALYRGVFKTLAGRLVAPMGLVFVSGAVDNHTFEDAPGDAANGLDVDVTRVPADPFGLNADPASGAGAAGSISAKLRQMRDDLVAMRTSLDTLDNTVSGANRLQVDIVSGGLSITRPANVNVTTPATSAATGTLIVSNANRLGLEVTNKASVILHLHRGASVATIANSTIAIDPGATWNDPTGYTGEIRCILASGGASTAAVAEFTA